MDRQTLSPLESQDLARLEGIIERGFSTFVEVGSALLNIRDNRLYRGTHPRFEEYCQERWGWTRSYANRCIAAASAVSNLGIIMEPIGSNNMTEGGIRPIASLPPEEQAAAWKVAKENGVNGKPTSASIKQAAKGVLSMSRRKYKVKSSEPKRGTSVILPVSLYDRLRKEADRVNTSISEVVRKSLELYLASEDQPGSKSGTV